jgi:hypothetical protein
MRVLCERTTTDADPAYSALYSSILYGGLRMPRHLLQMVEHFGSLREATPSGRTIVTVISKCIGAGGPG